MNLPGIKRRYYICKQNPLTLPDLAALERVHGAADGALESIREGGQVDGRAVHSEARRRVGIGEKALTNRGRGELRAPGLTETDEEELFVGETRNNRGLIVLIGVHVHISRVRRLQTTGVGDVLTLSQVTIHEVTRQGRELRVLLNDAVNTLLEGLRGTGSPPVNQLTSTIEISTLRIQRVSQFVTSNHTDTTIVHRIGEGRIEEGRLNDTSGEHLSLFKKQPQKPI